MSQGKSWQDSSHTSKIFIWVDPLTNVKIRKITHLICIFKIKEWNTQMVFTQSMTSLSKTFCIDCTICYFKCAVRNCENTKCSRYSQNNIYYIRLNLKSWSKAKSDNYFNHSFFKKCFEMPMLWINTIKWLIFTHLWILHYTELAIYIISLLHVLVQ